MSSRPRRSAAARAKEVISVQARADTGEKSDRGAMSFRRSGRASGATVSRDAPSSPGDDSHLSVTVKVPSNRLRQATRGGRRRSDPFEGGEIVQGKRNRGAKKSYVVDSSPDDDDDDEEEEKEEAEDDEMEEPEDEDDMEVDANGDDVDAEGEEDAEGDIDMMPRPAKDARSAKPKPAARAVVSKAQQRDEDEEDEEEEDEDEDEEEEDDDDDDLSEPADSDLGDETMGCGDETMADEDAEGEEIEVAGDEDIDEDEDEGEDEGEDEATTAVGRQVADRDTAGGRLDSDDENGSRYDTPDLAKMTKRQRARFEDVPQEYMKLSDEIQVKKVFTAEELSMRRQEMARRRRNLSEKRTEEVKMETINKLLKKQAPKINRKAAAEADNNEARKADPVFIRWVSNKNGIHVAIPDEILQGPTGTVFSGKPALSSGKLVEEMA